MDDAFIGIEHLVTAMLDFRGELVDESAGVRSYLTAYEISTPVELDVGRGADGEVQVGITPPVYRVETSIMPSFHTIRFRAEIDQDGRPAPNDWGLDG